MSSELSTAQELEAVVGARTDAGTYKSIPFLDEHCASMLARSPLTVLGHVRADGSLGTVLIGGNAGHAAPVTPTELALPALVLDDRAVDDRAVDDGALVDGAPVGLLSVVPGYGETLRINGRLSLGGATPSVVIEEAFVHCAKAIIRSKLWKDESIVAPSSGDAVIEVSGGAECLDHPAVRAFLAASPFVTLASVDGDERADVSPKGDPAGFVHVLDGGRLAVPDRPGNLRTDTLHNLLDQPALSLLALVPGSDHVLEVAGRAIVTDDDALREALVVNDKVPLAAVVIAATRVDLRRSTAIEASALWDTSRHIEPGSLPRASQMWSDHVQLHAGLGVDEDAERLVPVDGLHEGIQENYRDGLY